MTPITQPHEAAEFVLKIIDSCTTSFHYESAGRLIELFKEKYPRELRLKQLLYDKLTDLIQSNFPEPKNIGEA